MLGALLRLRQYVHNKSVWLDEMYIAHQIQKHSPWKLLLSPLEQNQTAPPGYLLSTKLSIALAGPTEYAFRALPFIASIGCLIAGLLLAKRSFQTNGAQYTLLLLLALSPTLGLYAAEGKQYGVDAAITTLILLQAAAPGALIHRWRSLLVTGLLTVFFSNSSLFLLFPLGLLLIAEQESRRSRRELLTALVVPGSWAALFLFLYFLVYHASAENPFLQSYWQKAFAPSPLELKKFFIWLQKTAVNVMQVAFGDAERYGRIAGKPNFAYANELLLCLTLLGSLKLWQSHRRLAILTFATIGTTLVASHLHTYPFKGRLILFLAPIIYLFVAALFEHRRWRVGVCLTSLLLLGATIGRSSVRSFVDPYDQPQARQMAECIKAVHQPEDRWALGELSGPAFAYYASSMNIHHKITARIPQQKALAKRKNREPVLKLLRENPNRWWLVFGHRLRGRDSNLAPIFALYPPLAICKAKGSAAYLIDSSRRETAPH